MVPPKIIITRSKNFGILGFGFLGLGFMIFLFGLDIRMVMRDKPIIFLSYILIVFGFVFIAIALVMKSFESKCGNKVKSDDAYCPKCGKKL